MKLADYLRFFPDVKLTKSQMAFCIYLESRGLRFCVDFGYENAADKAWELMDMEDAMWGWSVN